MEGLHIFRCTKNLIWTWNFPGFPTTSSKLLYPPKFRWRTEHCMCPKHHGRSGMRPRTLSKWIHLQSSEILRSLCPESVLSKRPFFPREMLTGWKPNQPQPDLPSENGSNRNKLFAMLKPLKTFPRHFWPRLILSPTKPFCHSRNCKQPAVAWCLSAWIQKLCGLHLKTTLLKPLELMLEHVGKLFPMTDPWCWYIYIYMYIC